MTLLGEIDALANDIVTTVFNVDNPTFVVDRNTVSDSHRVRTPYAFDTEITLDLTINQLAIVREDGVPAACILDDEAFHPTPS